MNLQLKFIVLAFSAFTLVNVASATDVPDNDALGVVNGRQSTGTLDAKLVKAAEQVIQEDKVAQDDQGKINHVKEELCDVVHAISDAGGTVFVRQFRRDLNYVFSNENVDRVSSFLKKVPVNMYLAAGVLIADSMVTGFVCDRPSQAVVLSVLAGYLWMNRPDADSFKRYMPDVGYYANCASAKVGNLLTNSFKAALSGIWGANKKD